MIHNLTCLIVCVVLLAVISPLARARDVSEFPKPSPYPISWEIKFVHSIPKRIVVADAAGGTPVPYWYITYAVTNASDKEQTFLPLFTMVTRTGQTIRSDDNIPAMVFDTIKKREKNRFLEPSFKIAGDLLIGDDQAKESVAIWREPDSRMGAFSIYVTGLSGESVALKDDKGAAMKDKDGQPIILRKTLQLNFLIRGDEVYPGEDEVNAKAEDWVMR